MFGMLSLETDCDNNAFRIALATMSGGFGSDSLLFLILAILMAFCIMAGLGLYTAVGLLRFLCMSPPVTLRQAMQGRQGGLTKCACCCCCGTFEQARQTPEQVQVDRALVKWLVTLFLVALIFMFLGMAICGAGGGSFHFMDQGSWQSSQFGATLQVLCAIQMFATACVTLLAGCCGCAVCSPQEPVG
eukprot:COSAG06_NODE_971_length_11273_cov_54.583497_14_plen_187_part_01